MICYKDRTFCVMAECKKYKTCPYAATEQLEQDAKAFGLPIAMSDEWECFE
jgi:hypothetical protein